MSAIKAEYIWLDGGRPTPGLRSKTKVVNHFINSPADAPEWAFDGSSTEQAEGRMSDCILRPVFACPDPIRGEPHMLVLSEVMNPDGSPHTSNTRARLRDLAAQYAAADAWFGIEQEYTLFQDGRPLGFPPDGFPGPQGPYYCGVGTDKTFGRPLVEEHLEACLRAGLRIAGINAEVMPGQWEIQVGPSGPLEVSDHMWIMRWLLQRIAEEHEVVVSFAPKPIAGDWNGAGAHTNFSTREMREPNGLRAIEAACQKLGTKHQDHILVYGAGNEARLTGRHETCSINEFRYGTLDRGASIRIPIYTVKNNAGYLEDRRPAANMDPYLVCARLIETVCGN